jgi:pentatricopeptide repeat protein
MYFFRLGVLLYVIAIRFTDILDQFVKAARFSEAYDLWERMHFEPGLQLTSESFAVMMRYCALQGQVERAFFYLDEMKSLGIEPTLDTFHGLFRACATAPHWVAEISSDFSFLEL